MGNVTVTEELAGSDELEELYRLDASETGPEDDEDEDDSQGGDDSQGEDDDEGIKPDEMPQG